MKKLIFFLIILLNFFWNPEPGDCANYCFINGQITDSVTHLGLANKVIYFYTADTQGTYTLFGTALSSQTGVYSKTVVFPDTTFKHLQVCVFGCNQFKYFKDTVLTYDSAMVWNKSICSPVPLHVTMSGKVTDSVTGLGVAYQVMYYSYTDTTGVVISASTQTDSTGWYIENIAIQNAIQDSLHIHTFGCNQFKYSYDTTFTNIVFWNRNFIICNPDTTPICHASFTYTIDSQNLLTVHFHDSSAGNPTIWQWNFGDGGTSAVQNPSHTYQSAGSYLVKLSVNTTANPSTMCSDSMVVVLTSFPVKSLAGQVFAGLFPAVINTPVFLYKVFGTDYYLYDTAFTDQNGIYYFYHIPVGDYAVRSIPVQNPLQTIWLPSYHSKAIRWQLASKIYLYQDTWDANIDYDSVLVLTPGQGVASGDVKFSNPPWAVAAKAVEVILYNSQMKALAYRFTANDGSFLFNGLPQGTYFVLAEIPGRTLDSLTFVISGSGPDTATLHILVPDNTIGIFEKEVAFSVSEVFPNPVTGSCKLILEVLKPDKGVLKVLDLEGRTMINESLIVYSGKNEIMLELSFLKAGPYFVLLQMNNTGILSRKLIKLSP